MRVTSRLSKGWKPESLAYFASHGTGAQAGNLPLSTRLAKLMLRANQKAFHSWGDHYAPHSAARGPNPFGVCNSCLGRCVGADRRAERPSRLHRRRRDGRRAGQRQEGRLDHHHHRRQRQGRPLQLPRKQARARPVRAPHPRRRIRSRQRQEPSRSRRRRPRRSISSSARPRTSRRSCRTANGSTASRATIRARACCSTAWAATRSSASCARRTAPTISSTPSLPRMQGYVNQSIPQHPQLRRGERRWRSAAINACRSTSAAAEFWASVNLSSKPQWGFDARSVAAAGRPRHPRDLHRIRSAARHHLAARRRSSIRTASPGTRTSASRILGRLDPKTGKVTEYPVPEHKPGYPDRFPGAAHRPRRQSVARQHVPGHDRQVRPQDREVHVLAAADRAEHRRRPGQHGEPAKLARRRQGLVAEQRLCRRAPARPRHRQDRDLGAVQGGQGAAQHLRRDPGLQEQRVLHRLPPAAHRPHRRQDRRGQDVRSADGRRRRRAAARWMRRTGCGSAQYRGDRIAMFDTKTEAFKEWRVMPRWSAPYDVSSTRTKRPGPARC